MDIRIGTDPTLTIQTTRWEGCSVKGRAVKGHEFALKIPPDDKEALIAFLKTL